MSAAGRHSAVVSARRARLGLGWHHYPKIPAEPWRFVPLQQQLKDRRARLWAAFRYRIPQSHSNEVKSGAFPRR